MEKLEAHLESLQSRYGMSFTQWTEGGLFSGASTETVQLVYLSLDVLAVFSLLLPLEIPLSHFQIFEDLQLL
jgi:hypothetical protein